MNGLGLVDHNGILLDSLSEFSDNLLPVNVEVSDWATKRRKIKPAGESFYELYDFSKAPYLKWLCDLTSPHSACKYLQICKGVRQGVTTGVILNKIMYNIDVNPTQMMFVSADQGLIDKFVRINFKPALQASDLTKKIKPMYANEANKNRSSGETRSLMEFYGNGYLALCGANNPNNFRQLEVRDLFLDESATYPRFKQEGWAVDVAKGRTLDSGDKAKIVQVSTPTVVGTAFHRDCIAGNPFEWQVPCPHCGAYQYLELGKTEKINGKREVLYGCIFEKDENYNLVSNKIEYMCKHCGFVFQENCKHELNQNGDWISLNNTPKNLENVTANVNSFYSSFFSWKEAIKDYLKALKSGLPSELQVVSNLYEGRFFEYKAKEVDANFLLHRISGYSKGEVPDDVACLTVTIDVQGNRLEGEVKGWSFEYINYSIDYKVWHGNTDKIDVWNELEDWIINKSQYANLKPIKILIDSGDGNMKEKVLSFCRTVNAKYRKKYKLSNPRSGIIYPLRGSNPKNNKGIDYIKREIGEDLWRLDINTYKYKEMVIENLNNEIIEYTDPKTKELRREMPDRYCSFPNDYGKKYFNQLTSERLEEDFDENMFPTKKWKSDGRRNEAFDLFVYNWCLMEYMMNEVLIPLYKKQQKTDKLVYNEVFQLLLEQRRKK